jgi:glutamate racemase
MTVRGRCVGVDLLAGIFHRMPQIMEARAPRIGVFDSGVGGLTVQREIVALMPGADVVYMADSAGFPYGPLTEAVLIERVVEVVGRLVENHRPDVVVVACNTASTLALPVLRARFDLPFVGTVPAIKPAAAMSRSRMITVLATPGTVARDYTRELVAAHAGGCRVTLVGSRNLAGIAERELCGDPASDAEIAAEIAPAFVEADGRRTDHIVLACTHYPLLQARFEALAPWPVAWIDPAPAIARRVAALVGSAADLPARGSRRALFTHDAPLASAFASALLGRYADEIGREPIAFAARRGTAC